MVGSDLFVSLLQRLRAYFVLRRIPYVVRQYGRTECGLACLSMIAAAWGLDVPIETLRRTLQVGRDGLSSDVMRKWLAANGFVVTIERKSVYEWKNVDSAMRVCFMAGSHYLVVEGYDKGSVYCVDPASGRIRLSVQKFQERFADYCLIVEPCRLTRKRKPLSKLHAVHRIVFSVYEGTKVARVHWGVLLLLVVLAEMMPLGSAWMTAMIINRAIAAEILTKYDWLLIIGFLCGVFTAAAAKSGITVLCNVGFGRRVLVDMADRLLALPLNEYRSLPAGDVIARMASIGGIRGFLITQAPALMIDFFTLILISCAVFLISPEIGILVIVSIFLFGVLVALTGGWMRSASFTLQEVHGQQNSLAVEMMRSGEYIKGCGLESMMHDRWVDAASNSAREELRLGVVQSAVSSFLRLAVVGMPVVLLGMMSMYVDRSALSVGGLAGFAGLLGAAFSSANGLLGAFDQVQSMAGVLERYADLVGRAELGPARFAGHAKLSSATHDTVFSVEDFGFFYPGDDTFVFECLNVSFVRGQSTAVVGRTGCGKSTFLRCLIGTETACCGRRIFDGVDEGDLSPASMFSIFGLVTQEVFLFEGSIFDNLVFGLPPHSVTEDDCWGALSDCQLESEIRAFPMGLYTQVGVDGSYLSGGQKQRLAIARALVRKPRILLLDEATSGCDIETETSIFRALRNLGITIVCVTHREALANSCDRILEM